MPASSALSICFAPTGSIAQDTIDPIDTDVIIVSGTKQELTLQEAEVSVEVFEASRLDQENLFELDDVLARIPNVNGRSASNITIRGISRSGTGGQGVTSNVYLDGAPISTAALTAGFDSVWDIEQIEVLRGPQSTVQGRNALAGAIVLRTNDPTYDWETKFRTRYASFDTQQYAAAISGPIIKDELAFRIAVDYQSTDGFITNALTLDDQANRNNLLTRAKLLVEPSRLPKLRAEFTIDYNKTSGGAFTSTVGAPENITTETFFNFDFDEFVTFLTPQSIDSDTIRVLTDITYDINDVWSIHLVGTHEDNKSLASVGDSQNPLRFAASSLNENFDNDEESLTTSGELRFQYDLGRWSGSIGGYYFQDRNEFVSTFVTPLARFASGLPLIPDNTTLSNQTNGFAEVRNFAFYGQTRFDLDERWTFDFSIRYDNERFTTPGEVTPLGIVNPDTCIVDIDKPTIDALFGRFNFSFPLTCTALVEAFTPGTTQFPETTTFSAVLPRGTVTYNITDDVSIFFSGQRGYRAGGTFSTVLGGVLQLGEFDPEFLTTYEIGFRSKSLDNSLTINGNFFYSTYRGQQVTVPGASGGDIDSTIENIGSSRIFGAEFFADYRATDNLNVYGSIGLLNTELTEFPYQLENRELDVQLPFQNLAGNNFPNAPTLSFTVGATYEHPSGFYSNASVNYLGSRETDIFNLNENDFAALATAFPTRFADLPVSDLTQRIDPNIAMNARIGYTEDHFSIYAYGSNLLNDNSPIAVSAATVIASTDPEAIEASGVIVLENGLQPTVTATRQFATPRVFGIGLDLTF